MNIYIVEDDEIIRNELISFLSKYGYECFSSIDFKNVAEDIIKSSPDLVLLDINLPFNDGFQICLKVRKSSCVPIIVVTSRNTPVDELMSLNIGADDFIAKPYDLQVLLAHIQAVLKRTSTSSKNMLLSHHGVTLDILKGKITYNEKEAELTKNELGILHLLMLNKGNIISRDELMNELWQSGEFVDENTLNVNIARLRKKLESLGLKNYLLTRRGQGYQI